MKYLANVKIFLLISLILAILLGYIAWSIFGLWSTSFIGFLWLILATKLIINAWVQVPNQWRYVIEKFGKFHKILEPGLYLIFPWFGFYTLRRKVYLGQQELPLFHNDLFDFKDGSAKLKLYAFLQVYHDPSQPIEESGIYKSAYSTHNSLRAVITSIEHFLRPILGKKRIQQTIETISFISENPEMLERMEDKIKDFGFQLKKLAFKDPVLSDRMVEIRDQQFEADMDIKIAVKEQKAAITRALTVKKTTEHKSEGDAQAKKNLAVAQAQELKDLIDQGLDPNQAATLLSNFRQFDALQNSKEIVWLGGGDSKVKAKGAALGAAIGAGKQATAGGPSPVAAKPSPAKPSVK